MNQQRDTSKPRPRILRALGPLEPPPEIQVDGLDFEHQSNLKHDSWAATAVYQRGTQRIVCKFNRTEPILLLPGSWIGNWLARREARMYNLFADIPAVPKANKVVSADGKTLPNAVAHHYVPGHPLRWHDQVNDRFFDDLRKSLVEMHRRGFAYVDMNKCENIIVGDDGQPHLIDFQISVRLPCVWPLTYVLRLLQQSDLYHLNKHAIRTRPDLYGFQHAAQFESARPWWIKLHRMIARPVRAARRRILVWIGVRRGRGKPQSELHAEDGLRSASIGREELQKLYSKLVSDEYVRVKGGTSRAYVFGMFQDLFDRKPTAKADMCLVNLLQSRERHDVAIGMLRSTEVYLRSKGWSDQWLSKRCQVIEQQLTKSALQDSQPPGSPQDRSAA